MSRRAYPQYNPSGQPVPQPGQLVPQPNAGYSAPSHGYPGPPAGGIAGPPQGNQGYIGPPGGGFASSSGHYPGVQSMTGQVHQMNLGQAAPPQEINQPRSSHPVPTAQYTRPSADTTQYPQQHGSNLGGGGGGRMPPTQQPIGSRPLASNIGPPPKQGEVYRPPPNPPPPTMGPPSQPPGSGGQYRPATSGGHFQPPMSGVQYRPTASGVLAQPPPGVSSQPPFPGARQQPPMPGVNSHPPSSQPSLSEVNSYPPTQSQPHSSALASQGHHQGAPSAGVNAFNAPLSRVSMHSNAAPPLAPPTMSSAPPTMSSAPPTSQVPTSGVMRIPPSSAPAPMAPPTSGMPTSARPTAPNMPMGPPTGLASALPPTQPHPSGPPTGNQMGQPPTGLTGLPGPPPTGIPAAAPPTGLAGLQRAGHAAHPLSGQAAGPPGSGMASGPPGSGMAAGPPGSGMAVGPPGSGMAVGPPGSGMAAGPPGSGMTTGPLGQGAVPPPLMGAGGYGRPQPGLIAGPVSLAPVSLGGGGGLGQAQPQPGMVTMPAAGNPDGFNPTDPFLQPVNLLEQRTILPATPIEPPPIVLPNGLARYGPDHRVFCCTMNAIPATSSMLSKLKLPLAIHLHPYKDMSTKDCPVIHPSVIVRCRSCRAYINPYVVFIDSRHWRCNLCFRANSLPEDFDIDPHSGHHSDRSHRMELKRSCIEYIAPSEYMVRPPQPSVYYFVVDVSFTSIDSGVLAVFCRSLLDHLDRLPGDARTMVGLLTFDSSLHFYSFPSTDSQPQVLVVSDVDDIFLPCPDSLLINLRDYKEIFRSLLEDLPRMFANNQSSKSALGPAVQAATKLLHPIGGRITIIQCALPNAGPGSLKYRDVAPGSTKMASLRMAPGSDFYKSVALDCNTQQIAIDLFAFSGQFIDLATMSCAAKFSSGQVFHYSDFHHSRQPAREKFQKDFRRYLTRKIGFEAVMRVRCTEGMSLHTFHGNFFVRSTDLLSLPCVNPDLGYTINISIDDNLKDFGSVCFQAALLYTSSRGERRIRVHTLCVPVSTQLAHVYARLNISAIIGTLANMGVDRATNATLGDAREALMNVVIDSGKVYRTNLASSRQASQFALPTSIRLLPLLTVALLKSAAFTLSTKVSYDRRTQAMNWIKCMPQDYYLRMLYPRLYAVHMITENDVVETDGGVEMVRPPILQLSAEKLDRYGVYLMDYGLGLYLWVCKDASPEYLSKILDVKHFGAIPEIMCELPSLKNDCSKMLCKLVRQIRSSRQYILPFQVIREDGPHRLLFIEKLVDDRTEFGTSYYELLSHIARQQK